MSGARGGDAGEGEILQEGAKLFVVGDVGGRWPSFAPSLADSGGAWPPKTCPRPFLLVVPRRVGFALTRGNSQGLAPTPVGVKGLRFEQTSLSGF